MIKTTTSENLERLIHALNASVSPFHTIEDSAAQLMEAGFQELALDEAWRLQKGGRYFVNAFASTLLAFTIGGSIDGQPALRIAASHTDWPCLKVKPSPEVASGRYGKLNVEVYGGPILSTWLDRPLSLAGKVSMTGETPWQPVTKLIDFKRPLLTIPNLAIHMNRDVNKGVELNPQQDMLPLLTLLTKDLEKDSFFVNLLADEAGCSKEDILDYELCIYCPEAPVVTGLHQEFLSAPRLDNITSVQACITGIIEGSAKLESQSHICVSALYDNEEIGSHTKQGAASPLTERILEKIYLSLGYDRSSFLNGLFSGFMLSMDVAHAIHPNHPEKCDIKNQISLNDGAALKLASSQAYATDATSTGVIEGLCRKYEIPYKKFSNRSDVRGGSTLGSISSSLLTMRTVDAGVPMLAMHSARELMGIEDQTALVNMTIAFFL